MHIKQSITNELINKNYYLHKALDEANNIILILEKENSRLKNVITNLSSKNNKTLENVFEEKTIGYAQHN